MGQVDRAADLPHLPDELADGPLQDLAQLRVVCHPAGHPYEVVDVLVGYSEVEQHFGQFIGVRQHEAPCEEYTEYDEHEEYERYEEFQEYVSKRSGGPDAYGQ
jgi:hypothetical protein